MRIRLRVPPEDDGKRVTEKKAGGFWSDFLGLFARTEPVPPKATPQFDHRWLSRGDMRFILAGRRCRHRSDGWYADYVYDVFADGELRQMRIVLPEELVRSWEQAQGQRMSEACRLSLVRETLESLLEHGRFLESIVVTSQAVAEVSN